MKEILVVKNLKKTFIMSKKQQRIEKSSSNIKVAVNDLSFTAYEGEIYGLLGPNGAGKTTTLRMLSTLIKADEGDATLEGFSIKENPTEIRKKIGFLTSELKLEDFYTPNYMFDYFAHLHGVSDEVILERKEKLFKRFGIDKFREVKIGDLSTGMKQKVSIAVSLVHDPKFIIFDEPTNGLDVITAKTVTDYLLELKEEGKTIIISTHIFSLVEKICDRVGVIVNGHMVEEGYVKEITKEKDLENVFFDIYKREVGE